MKKLVFLLIMVLSAGYTAYSQEDGTVDPKLKRKLTKEEKAIIKEAEERAMAQMVDSLIKERRFVLEAEYLSNQYGNRIVVNSLINFIIVDSNNIVIQIASTTGVGGYNGLGGITTRGRITSYEITKTGKARNNYAIRLMASTVIGTFDIFFNISPNSNTNATISGNSPGRLNYYGSIKPIEVSKVFKATAI